ncbi:hypothetical protein IT402_01735 [Candidatus Nomurabacteria bacterium]|nr:hypothetical protein [Candidatus Nomurabacteria bacterium]
MTEFAQSTQVPNVSRIRLISVTVSVVLFITFISLYVVFFLKPIGTQKEVEDNANPQSTAEAFHEGKIEYVDSRLYPGLEVTHVLTQSNGDIALLLKADDAILEVGEGHWAKIYGTIESESTAKYPVFKVNKVVIKSNLK